MTAVRLAGAGVDVAVNFVKDEEGARRVVGDAEAAGVRSLAVRGDVSRLEEAGA
ncbi:MAG: hypothetical protein M3348_18330, partial [Acidobacteriota bacterium]|nr:hypothetical protein [Acidobacteriota bacterium]